jgi:hypothetical protein
MVFLSDYNRTNYGVFILATLNYSALMKNQFVGNGKSDSWPLDLDVAYYVSLIKGTFNLE